MATIRINEFRGLVPKSDPRNLQQGFAAEAVDVRFDAGDLSPIRKAVDISNGLLGGDIGDIYHLGRRSGGRTQPLIAWGSALETYFLPGPVPDDQYSRFYWCVYNPAGSSTSDGIRCLPNAYVNQSNTGYAAAVGSGGALYRQHIGYAVGIPAPKFAPVAVDDTVFAKATNIADLSRTSPTTVSLNQSVPFKNNDLVRIVIDPSLPNGDEQPPEELPGEEIPGEEPPPQTTDPTIGRLWQLSGKEGRVANVGGSGSRTFDIVGISGAVLGQQALTTQERAAISIERVIRDSDLESRAYVYTFVSEYGEEGPPSPPSNIINVPATDGQAKITVQSAADPGGSNGNMRHIRLYRKVAGTSSGAFLFVGEFPMTNVSQPITVTDAVPAVALGEPLPSERWYPPPAGLRGAHVHPAGFFVAWKDNTLYFSEPYLPHAWNPDYKRTVDAEIVNVQSYGNTLVIGTTGRPYIATGVDPASMSIRKLDDFAPVMHPRAMVDAGQGVVYPSSIGLVMATAAGAKNLTEHLFDKKTWQEELAGFNRGIYHDNRIIFFGRGRVPWVLDFNGGQAELSRLSTGDYSAACIAGNDLVFVRKVVTSTGSTYNRAVRFKTSGQTEALRWRSGLITLPMACNLAAAQVFATSYPVSIRLYWANLQAGQARPDINTMQSYLHQVQGPEIFRLPATYRSREFVVEIISSQRVQGVSLSTSIDELRQT